MTATAPTPDALTLLSGDAQTFRDRVWASRVLVHRGEARDLVGLLSLADVDALLTTAGLRTPALRVVKDGTVLSPKSYTRAASIAGEPVSGLVDERRALQLYGDGATLVLQGLHRYWPPLTDLVRGLELQLGHPCQANAYLTPPGSQGFARHQDTHDVFVFQTHGQKTWTVGEEELLLEPGLCLYLPTGTPHSARTEAGASLHVTIGVNRLTRRDVLRRVVDEALRDSRYDEPLPAGYLDDPVRLAGVLADEVGALVKSIDALDAGELAGQSVERFLSSRPSYLRGALLDLDELATIDDDTWLERRPGTPCRLVASDQRLRVLIGDRELRMPRWVEPAMAHVVRHPKLRVGTLPLDADSRKVLARRLVRDGLLRIAR